MSRITRFCVFILALFLLVTNFTACRGGFGKQSEEAVALDTLKAGVERLNAQCPATINSWTTVESFSMDNKVITIKFVVDNDVIDALDEDGLKCDVYKIFKNQVWNMEYFGYALKSVGVSMKLLVYRTNGELEHTIMLEWNYFIYPPAEIRMQEINEKFKRNY